MILILENGQQLRGDMIRSAVVRSDLAPIPVTLETEIRYDEEIKRYLLEGKIIEANGDRFRIIKNNKMEIREMQGKRGIIFIRIIGLLDSVHTAAFVRKKAIIKENSTLTEIYRATGATLKAIEADFDVPRFYCPIGQVPTFQIAKILQEEGGVVRWKAGKMKFFRNPDLFKQKPVMALPKNADENVISGFQERHEVPWFYSTKPDGSIIYGNREKTRTTGFSPFKNTLRLNNMTRCLIQRKVAKVYYFARIAAGDLIEIYDSDPLVVVTAAHAFQSGTDGSGVKQYTRLWLAELSK
jgi:hypothetical protein